jgi:hypothetical protein
MAQLDPHVLCLGVRAGYFLLSHRPLMLFLFGPVTRIRKLRRWLQPTDYVDDFLPSLYASLSLTVQSIVT